MLVTVARAYGGAEGKRIKVGQQFWAKKPGTKDGPKGVPVITYQRFQQLNAQGILVPADAKGAPKPIKAAAPKPSRNRENAPTREPRAKVEPDSKPAATPDPRASTRENVPKDLPQRPRAKAGQTIAETSSSSSPLAPQTGSSTLKQRGTRRKGSGSAGSPSTTESSSSPGPMSSTPVTGDGGDTSGDSTDSAAFA